MSASGANVTVTPKRIAAWIAGLVLSVTGVVAVTSTTESSANSGLANYDKIIYFTDVRWWSDANPGDGVCATPTTVPAGAPSGVCTLLAAVQEANAWSTANPTDQLLITPADATLAGSLTGLNPWANQTSGSAWTLQQANWAIAPLTPGYTGTFPVQTAGAWGAAFGGMLSANTQSISALGNIGSDASDGSITLLYVTANNLTVDLQNRVGFWIYGDVCNAFPGSTGASSCSTIWGFNGQNQTFQNFGTQATASQNGAGAGLYMLNSEDNVVVGQNAVNFTLRNGYIGNSHTSSGGAAYANERGVVIIGGAQGITIDNVTFDGLAHAGLAFEPKSTDTSTVRSVIDGVSITNSTFQMNSRYDSGNYSYLGSGILGVRGNSTYAPPTVNNLVISQNTFRNFTMGGTFDSADGWTWGYSEPLDMEGFRTSGTSKIQSNLFTIDLPMSNFSNSNTAGRAMLLVTATNGGTLTISQNTFTHTALANPQFDAIALDTNATVGGQQPISGVTLADNAIANWGTTSQGTGIYARSTNASYPVSYTAYRNTFPGSVDGTQTENDYGTNNSVPIDNVGASLTAGPVNNFITTWYPSTTTADGSAMNVTVLAPTGGNGNAPAYPLFVDVYASTLGTNGLAQYVGQIPIPAATPSVTASLPFAGSPTTVRVQTRDAAGNTSQMSRTATVSTTDATPPMLWIDRSTAQDATTSRRAMSFVVASSEPLTGGATALTPSMFTNTGTAGPLTSVVVTPATPTTSNVVWYVTVQVSQAGTVIPQIAAGSVTDLVSLPNAVSNSAGILNPDDGLQYTSANFVGSLNNDGLGYPINALPGQDTVTYVSPLSLSSDTVLSLSETGPTSDIYTVDVLTNSDGTAAVAPTSYIYLSAENAVVTPDATVTPLTSAETWSTLPTATAADIAATTPNLAIIGHSDPYGDTSAHPDTMWAITPTYVSQDVTYTAVDNAVVDGTRTVSFDLKVYSADPNYDGLILPGITATVTDNDAPASSSTITTTVDNATADNSSTDTVRVTVLNQAGNPLQNALVTVTVPKNVTVVGTIPGSQSTTVDPSGVTTVTAVTGADGLITLTLRTGVGGTYTVSATAATKADNSDAVAIGAGTTATFVPQSIDATGSSFVVSTAQVPADGSTSATITVTAQTGAGFPATGQASHLSASANPSANVTVGSFTEVDAVDQPGVYTAPVTSTTIGPKTITVWLDGSTPITVSLGDNDQATFVAGAAASGTVSIDDATYISVESSSGHVVSVSLVDADGNPVSGVANDLTVPSPPAGVTVGSFTEDDPTNTPGVYVAVVTSTSSGSKAITVSHSGLGALSPTVNANFTAGVVDPSNSTWAVTPSGTKVANGADAFTGTVTLQDQYGNLVRNIGVTFDSPAAVTATPNYGTTGTDGTATTSFTSPTAGSYQVTATASTALGPVQIGQPVTIQFVASEIDISMTTLSTDNDHTVLPDGTSTHTATVTARGAWGNPVAGQTVLFSVGSGLDSGGTATLSATSAVTDANGVASVTITSPVVDRYQVSATIASVPVTNSPQTITFDTTGATNLTSMNTAPSNGSSPAVVLANGSDSWLVSVEAMLDGGTPVAGATVDFSADSGVVLSAPFAITDSSGRATVTATANTPGTYTVHAQIGGIEVGTYSHDADHASMVSPQQIVFTTAGPNASQSTIAASSATVVADGVSVHTVTVTIRDAADNPLSGVTPSITADPALTLQSQSSSTTDANGQIIYSYTSTTPSTGSGFEVSASVNSTPISGSPVGLQYRVGDPNLTNSTLVLSSTSATVGSSVSATATVLDAVNNPVSGVTVSFTASNSGSLSNPTCVTGAAGTCFVSVSDNVAEQVSVSASVTAGDLAGSPSTVTFTVGGLSGSNSVFSVAQTDTSASSVPADGSSSWTATLTAKDTFGNLLDNLSTSDIAFTPSDLSVSVSGMTNNGDGTYSAKLTSSAVVSATVSAYYQSTGIGLAQPVSFTAGAPDASQSTLGLSSLSSAAGTPVVATATVKDAQGHPVSGVTVSFTVTGSGSLSAASCQTLADGTCTVDVSDTTAETVSVAASIDVSGTPTGIGQSPTGVAFTAAAVDASNSLLEIDTNSPVTVGSSHAMTVTLRDQYGNVATSVTDSTKVAFACPTNTTCTTPTGTNGVFATTITSNIADDYHVTATWDGSAVGAPAMVTARFTAGAAASLTVSPTSQTVDQGTTASITVTVTDALGNPVGSAAVTGSVGGSASMVTATCTTNPDGECVLQVTDLAVETVQVTVASAPAASTTAAVTFRDNVPPTAPTVTTANGSQVAGTGEPGATVSVTWPDSTTSTVTVGGDGSWSVSTPSGMTSGTVTASQTDPAGNASPSTTASLDTQAPSAPVVNSPGSGSSVQGDPLTVTGTGEPGATVTVDAGSGKTCTATVAGDGSWSCEIANVPDGSASITVSQTDPAGNTSGDTTVGFTADSTAPSAPTIGTANASQVAGTGEPGATVTVTWPDSTTSTVTVGGDGTWSVSTPSGMTSGTVTASQTDPAGNASPSTTASLDAEVPSAPVVSSPSAGATVSADPLAVAGTGEPGATVTVDAGSGHTCTVTVAGDGSWSCQIAGVPDGSTSVTVAQTDPAGNTSDNTTVSFTADSTAPSAPTIASANATQIAGTGEPGATVTVTWPDSSTSTATVATDGTWSVTTPSTMTSGTVSASQTDAAGNVSPSTTASLNTQAPSAPTITTANASQVAGTGQPGATVTVTWPDSSTSTATVGAGGTWSVSTPSGMVSGTVTASQTDSTGNTSPTATATLDTQAPSAPAVSSPGTGSTVQADPLVVTGTGEPGATVSVDAGSGKTCTATVAGDGSWSCQILGIPDGSASITVSQTDPAGNQSGDTTVGFTADSTAPSAPAISTANGSQVAGTGEPGATVTVTWPDSTTSTVTVGGDGSWSVSTPSTMVSGTVSASQADPAGNVSPSTTASLDTQAPSAPAITTANASELAGTGEPGATVTVTWPDSTTSTVTVGGDGTWSISTPSGMDSGTVTASQTDPAGNTSPSTTASLDTQAPSAPTVTSPGSGSTVKGDPLTVTGTGEAGATVTVDAGSGKTCTATVAGDGSWSCQIAGVADGSASITVAQTDPAGNKSGDTTVGFTADSTAPSAPVISTANASVLAGTGEPGATVTVTWPDSTTSTVTVGGDGSWSIATPSSMGSGNVTASQTDAVGNVSPTTTATLDTQAPDEPIVSSPGSGSAVFSDPLTVTGTGEPGATVNVDAGSGRTCTATVAVDGSWSCQIAGLPDGSASITVSQTDPAGNESGDVTVSFTADSTAPPTPTITTANATVLSGTGEAGATVHVTWPDGGTHEVAVAGDGTWSVPTPTGMTSGTVHVYQTTVGGVSATVTANLDTQAPDAPAVTTANASQVSGTGEAGATVTVTWPDSTTSTVTVGGDGTWSVTTPSGMGSGTITASQTDPAGNTSPTTTATLDTQTPSAPVVTVPSSDSTVQGDPLTVAGTGEPGATVTVDAGSGNTCTATVAGDGSWSCQVANVPDGSASITVSQTDPAGNKSGDTTVGFTADSTAPSAPTISTANASELSGTGEPGASVVVTWPDSTTSVVTVAGDGTWSVPTPSGMASGTVTASQTDIAGNTSPTTTATLDTQAPSAPAVSSPGSGSTVLGDPLTVTGTGEPGATVTVDAGSGNTCTATVAGDGSWSCQVANVPDGSASITVSQTDPAGNKSGDTTVGFTTDSTAPSAPTITTANASEIAGTGEPGATVTIRLPDGTTSTATVAGDGTWSVTTPSGILSGTISASQTDAAGNVSPSTTASLDTQVPSAPVTIKANASEVSGGGEPGATVTVTWPDSTTSTAIVAGDGTWTMPTPIGMTSGTVTAYETDPAGNVSPPATAVLDTQVPSAPTITTANASQVAGTGEAGATVTVTWPDATTSTVTAGADGSWSVTTPSGMGSGTVTASQTDIAGNTSPPTSATLDTQAPDAPAITTANGSEVAGTGEPGGTVTVTWPDSTTSTATVAGDGTWSVTTPAGMASGTVTASQNDPAGNASPSATATLDTQAPSAPVVSSPGSGSTVFGDPLTVTGTGEPGATVTVDAGSGNTCTATVASDGSWSCLVANVPDGSASITVSQTDPAGNNSGDTTVGFTADSTAPSAPAISTANAAELAGTGEPGATVTVTWPDSSTSTVTVGGDGSWSIATPSGMGSGNVTASQTDGAGNVSPTTTATLDTQAPSAPVVSSPGSGSAVFSDPLTVTGTGEPGATVNVDAGSGKTCTATVAVDGSWSCQIAGLPDGSASVTVSQTDPAGNQSADTTVGFTADSTAPATPTVTTANASVLAGSGVPDATIHVTWPGGATGTATVAGDGTWSLPTPSGTSSGIVYLYQTTVGGDSATVTASLDTQAPDAPAVTTANASQVSGTGEAGATVTVTWPDSTTSTVTVGGDGTWSVTTPSGMSSGTITASQTDPAGNASPTTTATLDTQAPPAPAVTSPASGSTASGDPLTVTGTGEPGATVTVDAGSGKTCTATVAGDGSWSCQIANVPDGSVSITVSQTDPAGNKSSDTTVGFTADSATPSTPAITTANATQIAGTGEPGATVTITWPGGATGTATVTAGGTWSLPTPAGTSSGTVSVYQTTVVGNSATVTATLDTSVPAAPVINTANATEVGGTGEPGATVNLTWPDGSSTSKTVGADGKWAFPTPSGMSAGTVTASQTDPAGNTSPPATKTLNPVPPAAPGVLIADHTAVTGTGDPGATLTLTWPNGTTATVLVDASGTWTFATSPTMPPGTIKVSQTDPHGNTSPTTMSSLAIPGVPAPDIAVANTTQVSGTGVAGYTITVTWPGGKTAATTVNSDGTWSVSTPTGVRAGNVTARQTNPRGMNASATVKLETGMPTTPTIDSANDTGVYGTGTPGDIVTVTWPDGTSTAVLVLSDGTWSVQTPPDMPPGQITVTATDAYGNTSAPVTRALKESLAATGAQVTGAHITGIATLLLAGLLTLIGVLRGAPAPAANTRLRREPTR